MEVILMNSCELVTLVSSIACFLAQNCSSDELSVMSAVFSQLGDTLDTILTHQEICGHKDG